jgi:ankyrin repeat protein
LGFATLAAVGADVNMLSKNGATPILIAAQQVRLDVVKALASFGAGLNSARVDGATPILIAARGAQLAW